MSTAIASWEPLGDRGTVFAIREIPHADGPADLSSEAIWKDPIADHLDRDPRALVFSHADSGMPELSGAPGIRAISFSASQRVSACAISRAGPIGIDVECLQTFPEATAMHMLASAPGERAQLGSQFPEESAVLHLFRAWTAKEAALKAHGTGLRIEPRSCVLSAFGASDCRATIEGQAYSVRWFIRHRLMLAVAEQQ